MNNDYNTTLNCEINFFRDTIKELILHMASIYYSTTINIINKNQYKNNLNLKNIVDLVKIMKSFGKMHDIKTALIH